MSNFPKVLVLILGTKDVRYRDFVKACNATWVSKLDAVGIQCLFYQGGGDKTEVFENQLTLCSDDSLPGTSKKLLDALSWVSREIEFDYLFRTNLSSYIYADAFYDFIKLLDNKSLYTGCMGSYYLKYPVLNKFGLLHKVASFSDIGNKINFASGAGFWLSSDNVKLLLSDARVDVDLIDDVMVGESMSRKKVTVTPVSRIELSGEKIVYSADLIQNKSLLNSCYHVRLKSTDRATDVKRFYMLDKMKCFDQDLFLKLDKS